jgi:hypothetical protein
MYCIHCGTENPNNVNYCKECGHHFLRKQLQEIQDEYIINVCISVITGICTGVISGIFSFSISSMWHPELWQATILYVVSLLTIVGLIYYVVKILEKSIKNRIKRNL